MRKTMFQKLSAAVGIGLMSIGALAATPAAARDHYRPGDHYRGYDRGHEYRGNYGRDRYRGDYRNARSYRGGNYYRSGYQCRDDGTGGAIIGAVAGGLLGNSVARPGDRTTGAVLGAAVGALAGHAIDKNDGRRC
ncbi:MAG: glycine zipper 2TM domain-containing protein [Sphingobium sp.]